MPHNTVRDAARRKRRKKKKGRTWAEAARTVLEKHHNTPMSHKEILQVIQREGLKEISGTSPLACLNAMLHTNSRGEEGMFYKVPGRMGVYTLKKDVADMVKDLSDCSEDSSEAQSDSQGSEHSSSSSSSSAASSKDRRRSCWKRKVTSRVSQPSSPQPSSPSPPIPAGKAFSPSQKLSKKALKQALKQQQQRKQQQRRAGMPVPSSQHLLLKTVKTTSNITTAKPTPAHTWTAKHLEEPPRAQQVATPASTLAGKSKEALHGLGKKGLQRSDQLRDKQLKRTKCAEIDVETPESILVNTNLRALINKHTFSLLPVDCQQKLLLLLPEVDRLAGQDGLLKLNSSGLNNEFFTSASQSWKERLAEGEFTPEMQLRIRQEIEKEKKVEVWKEKFYESYYGEISGLTMEEFSEMTADDGDIQETPSTNTTSKAAEEKTKAPNIALVEDHTPVKTEDQIKPVTSFSEIRQAMPQPETPDTGASIQESPEKAVEKKTDIVEEQKETIPGASTDCIAKDAKPTSHICMTPCQPKSPALVHPANIARKAELGDAGALEKSKEVSPPSGAKRHLGVDKDFLAGPEKSPRLMPPSKSPQPFRALCKPRMETAQQTPEREVSPLKIPMAWISLKPFSGSRVSHRSPFSATCTSPGRTGARTLADIKAKAQLARARKAAAAAASGASVPGPGPGGGRVGHGIGPGNPNQENRERLLDLGNTGSGRGERGPSALSPTNQNQGTGKAAEQISAHSAAGAQLLQKPCVQPRIPTTVADSCSSENTRNISLTSERDSSLKVRKPDPPPVTLDKLVQFPKVSGLGTLAHSAEDKLSESTKGALISRAAPEIPAIISSAPQLASSSPACSFTNDSSSVQLKTYQENKTTSKPSKDSSVNTLQMGTSSGPLTRSSSSIPANNPLVTKLLQGKNVPLEQILPRPLTKVEMSAVPLARADRPSNMSSSSHGPEDTERPSSAAAQQLERFLCQNRQHPTGQRILQLFSGKNLTNSSNQRGQGPVMDCASQGQILQSLIKKVWQEKSANATNPPEHNDCTPPKEHISHKFMLGFVGRQVSKPAMSGHYLLNLSTYGRVPERFRTPTETSFSEPSHLINPNDETASVTESEEEVFESEDSTSECPSSTIKDESHCQVALPHKSDTLPNRNVKNEHYPAFDLKETVQIVTRGNIYSDANIARDLAKMADALGAQLKQNNSDMFAVHPSTGSQLQHLETAQPHLSYGNSPSLIGSSYGGTIKISTSPEGLNRSSAQTGGGFTSSNTDNVVSFSLTVTAIPSSHSVNSGCPDQPISVQAYTDTGDIQLSPSKCYCRLKAMIMCKGCGAFCHVDCIGPSKLCVSCLVVR
ncbi:putative Polycomb group protein ASXL2 [Gastrophryne carolinensis]